MLDVLISNTRSVLRNPLRTASAGNWVKSRRGRNRTMGVRPTANTSHGRCWPSAL